jgi:hypothetical protein
MRGSLASICASYRPKDDEMIFNIFPKLYSLIKDDSLALFSRLYFNVFYTKEAQISLSTQCGVAHAI